MIPLEVIKKITYWAMLRQIFAEKVLKDPSNDELLRDFDYICKILYERSRDWQRVKRSKEVELADELWLNQRKRIYEQYGDFHIPNLDDYEELILR